MSCRCSDDESLRFESRVVAKEHRILKVLPSLRELVRRLQRSAAHSASFELRRVYDVVEILEKEEKGTLG